MDKVFYILIFQIIFYSNIFAQKIEFDIFDIYNGQDIDLDSVFFYCHALKIDTIIPYSKVIDISDILEMNSVSTENFIDIAISGNSLRINSKEQMRSVEVYDILGRTILNSNVNSNYVNKNFPTNNRSLCYFIKIETATKTIYKKLLNNYKDEYMVMDVMPTRILWTIGLIKKNYMTKNLENISLPEKINTGLSKIIAVSQFDIKFINLLYFDDYNTNNKYFYKNDTVTYKFNIFYYDIINKDNNSIYPFSYTYIDRTNVIGKEIYDAVIYIDDSLNIKNIEIRYGEEMGVYLEKTSIIFHFSGFNLLKYYIPGESKVIDLSNGDPSVEFDYFYIYIDDEKKYNTTHTVVNSDSTKIEGTISFEFY